MWDTEKQCEVREPVEARKREKERESEREGKRSVHAKAR